ncbi:MAG: peptide ABC transporter substrate-binding protein [Dehalococcoidia bacterium]|nr:peptide ABC transporter substrate-binding protein [Dehalococcoidia bacterium]
MIRLLQATRGIVLSLLVVFGSTGIFIFNQGCSSDGNGEPIEQNGESADGGSTSADGTLRVPGGDPVTLDPALAGDAISATYVVELFGGLVTIDKDLNVVGDIAESWEISPDGRVYTFHLRDNVVFHYSNRLVTAEDFKYSMERAADPQTASIVAEAYLGDIVGARDMIRGRADEISGIKVVDDFTLEITIDEPKPYFLAKLTYPTAFVVDKDQIESNPRNWLRKPHGTGPYKLKEWRLGESILLEANDRYHLGAPSVKTVEFLLSGGSILTMYQNNELDVAGVSINDIERVQDPNDPLSDEYVSADELSISYLGFNTQKPPFDDANVRRAFGMAIDREKIAEVLLMDMLPVAHSIMPPGLPGYNPDARGPTYDPEQARQLLAESKYGGPGGLPKVTITEIGGGATAGSDTQAMIEMWKDNLGVEVEIEQTEEATFWQDLDKGQYQMFTAGWIMDYPDPEDILDILFYSKSRQNNTRYSNAEVDALLLQARTEQDVAARMALYQQAEQIILDEAPWIPLYYGRDHVVVKPYVKNYLLPPMVIPKLRYVTLEQ